MSAPRDQNGNPSIAYFAEIQARDRAALGFMGEIKLLAKLDTNAKRALYLETVLEKRGRAEYERLRKAVWEYMQANGIVPEPLQEALFA